MKAHALILGRFFRVSRQPVSSESGANEDESDASEDGEPEIITEDNDPRMIAYRDAELAFQDYATRRYFLHASNQSEEPEQGLRAKFSHAHVHILETCVDLIIGLGESKLPRNRLSNDLQRYAIGHWQQHFEQLSDLSDDTVVSHTVRIFYQIAMNAAAFATAILHHGPFIEVVFPARQEGQIQWYDRLCLLVDKARGSEKIIFTKEIQQWLQRRNEELILLPLAEGWHQAWISEIDPWDLVESYRAVRTLLKLVRQI
jgi:hypothetical protein